MSLYSDKDITKSLNKDIVIEPFTPKRLTPIGYDFTVGEYVYSLESGIINIADGAYAIPPKNTVQIMTKESLWVSGRIGGTFHSKVSLVSKGLSHISTTLDPNWYGPLLITLRNNTDKAINLHPEDPFVTLVFARVRTPTNMPHKKLPFRKDILVEQLQNQTQEYIDKISNVLNDESISEIFRTKVKEANQPMMIKIKSSVDSIDREVISKLLVKSGLLLLILLLAFLHLYWDYIKIFFHNIQYDSKVFAVQITAIIAVLSLFVSITRKIK